MTTIQLIACGLLGLLAHNLFKIKNLQEKGKWIAIKDFYAKEWASIALSFVLVIALVMVQGEVKQLHVASVQMGPFFGVFMVIWGYAGQSIFLNVVNMVRTKTEKVLSE
jgi:hypothetical protein